MNEQKSKKGIAIFLVVIVVLCAIVAIFTIWGKQNNKKEISIRLGETINENIRC